MKHLASRLLPECRSATASEACCGALAPPNAAACSPRWAATLQVHAERVRAAHSAANTSCAGVSTAEARVCPFASAEFVAGSPCLAPACARLWSAGEMDAACTVAIANFCKGAGKTSSACAWYAAAHRPCRGFVSSGNSTWFACATAQGYAQETSVVDETGAARTRALRGGHTTASMDAFKWMSTDHASRLTFVAYFVSPTDIRLAAARGAADPFLLYTPIVSAQAIVLPILVVAVLAYFAVLEAVLAQRARERRTQKYKQ